MQISRVLLALLPFLAIALAIPLQVNPAEAGRSTLQNLSLFLFDVRIRRRTFQARFQLFPGFTRSPRFAEGHSLAAG